jgi:histidine ammonia-lyase
MKTTITLDGQSLTIDDIALVANSTPDQVEVELSPSAKDNINRSNDFINNIISSNKVVYGINTGFGALSSKRIENKDLEQLQTNLIRSHCTGTGRPFSREVTRAIMLLRANCLVSGFSGVSPSAIHLLIDFLNHDINPVVPCKGSVGASGDLAPLSHIALALIGEGDVVYDGKVINSSFAIKDIGKEPAKLGPKDGLALINGTAVMVALGSLAIHRTETLMKVADICAACTLEGIHGTVAAFDARISKLKPHPGQVTVAKNLVTFLEDSEIVTSHAECDKVQDPYSLRCVPQVHGAARQTLRHAKEVFHYELNSVTDNPLVFVDEEETISGGNFHGQAIALAMDYLAMGIAEIASISERRIEKMMNPSFSGLPPFLIENSGLNSGLMIAHVTAAALTSENKGLCHPASIDSIPTSTDKEDHVSMGVTSGRKLLEIIDNTQNVLAIELLCATQAIEFHRPLKSSHHVEKILSTIRKYVEPIEQDRVFSHDIQQIKRLIEGTELLQSVQGVLQ